MVFFSDCPVSRGSFQEPLRDNDRVGSSVTGAAIFLAISLRFLMPRPTLLTLLFLNNGLFHFLQPFTGRLNLFAFGIIAKKLVVDDLGRILFGELFKC